MQSGSREKPPVSGSELPLLLRRWRRRRRANRGAPAAGWHCQADAGSPRAHALAIQMASRCC